MMPTHTKFKATCCTLTPPNLLQTLPQAAHTMRYRLKKDGVTSVDLKCEERFKNNVYRKLTCNCQIGNINAIIHQQQYFLFWILQIFVGSKTKIFTEVPPMEAQIQPDDTLLCK